MKYTAAVLRSERAFFGKRSKKRRIKVLRDPNIKFKGRKTVGRVKDKRSKILKLLKKKKKLEEQETNKCLNIVKYFSFRFLIYDKNTEKNCRRKERLRSLSKNRKKNEKSWKFREIKIRKQQQLITGHLKFQNNGKRSKTWKIVNKKIVSNSLLAFRFNSTHPSYSHLHLRNRSSSDNSLSSSSPSSTPFSSTVLPNPPTHLRKKIKSFVSPHLKSN